MGFIYNIGIKLAETVLPCIAPFNQKIKKGVVGRRETFSVLKENLYSNDKTLWFHCASLGEYEQGLPVFKALREHYKAHKIVLSFFSPSGYEIRKNSPIADIVVYLPLDSKRNAKRFIDLIKPELTVFVKYDIWPNFLSEIKKHNFKSILISAAFRPNQTYFNFYGKHFRNALFSFEHIFTQNENSKTLLRAIGYDNVTVSGDTRFDRVSSQLEMDNTLNFIEQFKQNKLCVVAGSTWPEGEALFINFINKHALNDIKFIIAPHNIKPNQIANLKDKLKVKCVLFSEKESASLDTAKVFIVDTIGILTKIYNYADVAYVGGALGSTGLHNTLEPAVFGVPIIIGNHYDKFPEANALIENGGTFSISNQQEFNTILTRLIENKKDRELAGSKNATFIKSHKGAVNTITQYLNI
ncbi:3-deoxy-D-manno-octulosonic acid transferase [Aestuariibaculum sp. TT11]|uniref:3-deoxy-D-manno-octulosonic acid transferase n=1 Tax=Aestuariibaculum sediminum TaxID=2770637 RepID=A0A8J6Q099_9FLAO|nr:3-deoxy-D-manno-octulosonic acid transferase [Aestuariibaculum sediminum]